MFKQKPKFPTKCSDNVRSKKCVVKWSGTYLLLFLLTYGIASLAVKYFVEQEMKKQLKELAKQIENSNLVI
jgi:ABC-type siderophore export system fused ATPase/permease subunit